MKRKKKFPQHYDKIKRGVKLNLSDTKIGLQIGTSRQYVFQIRKKYNLSKPQIKL